MPTTSSTCSMTPCANGAPRSTTTASLSSLPACRPAPSSTTAPTASPPITGPEWLAFEPEHAIIFAGPRHGGGGPSPGPHRHGSDENPDLPKGPDELRRRTETGPFEKPPHYDGPGFLHTYAAAKDLRLLYVDGESAAKTEKGTLDSQDVVLLNITAGGFRGGDHDRAEKACTLANGDWGGKVDGLLRMEAGFEVILCDFERDLTLLRVSRVKMQNNQEREGEGRQRPGPTPDALRWLRAVSERYDGIGGHRVRLNFDSFVTAFSHDVDLFPGKGELPRLTGLDANEVKKIREEVFHAILTIDAAAPSWDWQATVDMIVKRYGDELSYFASGKVNSIESLRAQISLLMSPFIDYSGRNTTLEAERCATQFLPLQMQHSSSVPGRAVHHVALHICQTIFEAAGQDGLGPAIKSFQALVKQLDWTTWKACRGCQDNEICVVPIWPMGSVADYNNPKCKDASRPYDSDDESYWGRMPHSLEGDYLKWV
ncbi:hypothetical protein N7468_009442 [Penicillium chermesinum]|uniref:Uncharacterized protein n=1 Tax=Penicillium chermesinum TaxID=63820 RepID=A0A9W9NKB5_9EURO|nr:uncharacterized protein N7468_009442 [Penicillium chermesinum]KAJ5220238.1 hypothetical protein N7468_009442 [Penicillium chermesinum]